MSRPWRISGNPASPLAFPAWELFVLLLTGLSILNAAAVSGVGLAGPSGPAQEVIVAMEVAMTPLFLIDFVHRLRAAPSAYVYLVHEHGWADLLGSVPLLRIFRVVRVARVIQEMRLLGRDQLAAQLRASRAMATFLMTVFLVIAVVEIASATIYYAEKGSMGANIETASDAIWWSLVTITTVGYGDRYPVTPEGRVIGAFLLFAGIALFSVLTGFIANAFLAPRARPARIQDARDARGALAAARSLVADHERQTETLRQQLEDLERVLDAEGAGRHGQGRRPPAA